MLASTTLVRREGDRLGEIDADGTRWGSSQPVRRSDPPIEENGTPTLERVHSAKFGDRCPSLSLPWKPKEHPPNSLTSSLFGLTKHRNRRKLESRNETCLSTEIGCSGPGWLVARRSQNEEAAHKGRQSCLAEREGFEPPELSLSGFQDHRHRPLGHLSACALRVAVSQYRHS